MFFTLEKIEARLPELRAAIYRESQSIPVFKYLPENCPAAAHPGFDDSAWADFKVGDTWGGYDQTAWFRANVHIPEDWRSQRVFLRFLVGPRDGGGSTAETMLYVNGQPLQGIDVWHEEAWLPNELLRAGEIQIALKSWSGVLDVPKRRQFKEARLVRVDPGAERLYFLTDTLFKAIQVMDENSLGRIRLVQMINEAYHQVDFCQPGSDSFYESIAQAAGWLDEQLRDASLPGDLKPVVTGVGHAHIDLAWLWRLKDTREKAARTFATALHLMRQYPEYCFVHSTPQLYKFLKEDYPDLYACVREQINNGQWEITGGTWVEMDTNLVSGESLVRQFLFGANWVRREFGREMTTLWLPDVFGYSYALPQIIRKSGIKYFLTSKISWSQFNRFPYDTFQWRGLDGTEVLTHFVTTPEDGSWFYTYNGQMRPEDVKGIWDAYRQKDLNTNLMMLYGWGDGGGGPTREMLEAARIQKNLPGMPRVELGKAEPFMDCLADTVRDKALPVWDGELYLEYHRGTYTSQAATKRSNRKSEILYHNAEWLNALADTLTRQPLYPAEELNQGWELILYNQFHDILPGSSIRQVYEDSTIDYQRVAEIGQNALDSAQQRLAERLPAAKDGLVVYNPLGWQRDALLELPGSLDLPETAGQRVQQDGESRWLVQAAELPSLGYRQLGVDNLATPRDSSLSIREDVLENRYYRLELNERGQLTSIYDKRSEREVLAKGQRGNVLQVFEDKPLRFDAWDIDIYYQEKKQEIHHLVERVVEETGPLRGALRLVWRFNGSTITQRITLYHDSPRIDFRTEVDWREQQVLLKAAFPVQVRATSATYDIQFGSIERPSHWNTPWDYARFEVCAHKWADLSEGNYGVALLNDCKYGYDIKDNVMRLTLIKSAIRPDPLADKGRHVFTYSLLPHSGGWRAGGVVEEAYALNNPALAAWNPARAGESTAGDLPERYSFASVDAGNVILETVKKAEDEDAWIVRVYENQQCRGQRVQLTFGLPLRKAVECNLVEREEMPVAFRDQRLTFDIQPFEIKTFKVWFA